MYTLTRGDREDDQEKHRALFFMAEQRRQFLVQQDRAPQDIGRGIALFLKQPFQQSKSILKEKLGFDFEEWMTFCFLVDAGTQGKTPPIITPKYFEAPEAGIIPATVVQNGFRLLSRSVDELGEEFRALREHAPTLLDSQLPFLLAERPLIDLGEQKYLVTHGPLVMSRAVEGIYDLCMEHLKHPFDHEFGSAYQLYIGRLLEELPGPKSIVSESQLASRMSGPVCDYVVGMGDSIIVLECKATEYSATYITENAIRETTSTGRIAEGLGQVANVARAVRRGDLRDLMGEVSARKILGIVVTYRDIALVNGQLYSSLLEGLVSLPEGYSLDSLFDWRPQILGTGAFEMLINAVAQGRTTNSLFEEKLKRPYRETGEWDLYLSKLQPEQPIVLPFLAGVVRTFYNTFQARMEAHRVELDGTP
jgi:hypothetical protein